MTHDEAARLHQRIDELSKDVNTGFRVLGERVATIASSCVAHKRAIDVVGDLRDRVTTLESQRAGAVKVITLLIAASGVGGTIAGVVLALIQHLSR